MKCKTDVDIDGNVPDGLKADVDIDVNVVVPVTGLSYIATNRLNIDRAAGGLRYAILNMIFNRPLAAGGLRYAILITDLVWSR